MKATDNSIDENQAKAQQLARDSVQRLVRQLRDEADLCRNETATDIADLLDAAAKELDGMALLTAGREQDQAELKICVNALDRIACDREWVTRKDMIQISGRALCDIGAWREVKQGEFARHGEILSNPAVVSMMNIQHEETGRMQEWPVDKPIPHGWARVSDLYLPNS